MLTSLHFENFTFFLLTSDFTSVCTLLTPNEAISIHRSSTRAFYILTSRNHVPMYVVVVILCIIVDFDQFITRFSTIISASTAKKRICKACEVI